MSDVGVARRWVADAAAEPEVEAERALIARAAAGDGEAFAELVRAHQAAVYRVVAASLGPGEAEDATQEVFVRIHGALPRFEGRARFRTWAHRIAVRVALNRLRRRRRKPDPAPLPQDGTPTRDRVDPGARLGAAELQAQLQRALADLPEEQRAVVLLRGVEGLSFEEVSRTLEIPLPTAHSRMARARERLRGALRAFLPPDEGRRV